MKRFYIKSISFALALILLPSLYGQDNQVTPVTRINETVKIDGKVDESFWSDIQPLELRTQVPKFDQEPTRKSEFRIAYDDEYLYYSGKMFVDSPKEITDNSKKRDAFTITDYFGINIDSYNDKTNSLAFFTAPSGLRFDCAVFNDGQGSFPVNLSWNNFWDVSVTQDQKGWYAEMRIPWSSLQFEAQDGKVVMGLAGWRYHAAANEQSIFPLIDPAMGDWASWRPSLAREFSFENIYPKKPFYVTPYVLSGFSSMQELNDAETAYIKDDQFKREVGVDVKYGISNNWTLDLSLNTDFAQVEVDDAQVNLSRFSLFFPEKRLFFQERSGIFNFNFGGGGDQVFYSRRIGIDDDGNPVRILGGARLTGRSGNLDVGLINMQTADTDEQNAQNYSVVRLAKNVINQNSQVGFIMTNKTDFKGDYNTVVGLDGTIRFVKDLFLNLRWTQSFQDETESKIFDEAQTKYWVSVTRRSDRGLTGGVSFSASGLDYEPDLGFEQRDNYIRHGHRIQYNWFPKSGPIFKHGPITRGRFFWSKDTKELETISYGSGYNIQLRNNWAFSVSYRPQLELIREAFDIGDVVDIPMGRYTFNSVSAEIQSDFSQPIFANARFETGDFYDGTKTTFGITPGFNISSSLELSGTYVYNKINFDVRDQSVGIHLAQINALYMFSTKFSVAAILQYNTLDQQYLGNVRLRYNPKEGNDLFIVYNDLLNTDRFRDSIEIPTSTERTILLKYSYTFRL